MKKELGIFILLIVLCVIVSVVNPNFLLANNLQNLARQIGAFGIFSIGLGLVIITGGIELSVGSMMALLGVLMSMMLTEYGYGVPLTVLACIGLAMALSLGHGLLITRLNMQPFIVTLCGLLFYRGLARFITNDETKGFGAVGFDSLRFLANGNLLRIPMPFVLLIIIAAITWVVLHRSVYGRYLFATGRNSEAARYAGIDTNRIITLTYVISGALTAISGIIFAFYTNSVSPANHGNAYELYGIAAAVLGGCSLRGGEGSVVGILIGTALLQVLRNLVNLLGIPSSLDFAVMGAVMWVVLHRSVYGRHLFATGRNEIAARFSGIDVRRVIVAAYVILGVLTGISAIIFAFYTNSISPSSHGSFFELYGIAAAVLGGCSLRGGEGSIIGILLGTTLLQVLQNLVNLLGIPSSLNFAVMGGVILVGVVGDQILQRRAAYVRS